MNLYTIIRHFSPQRFVEIGSGHSSKVISDALEKNRHDNPSQAPEYKIIDPYPSEIIPKLRAIAQLVKEKVECADLKSCWP